MDVNLIVVAVACLVVGLLVGSLLTRTLSPQAKQKKELESRLQKKEDELKIYQQDVADHFLKTSDIVRQLTQSQRDICEHLATGAMRLTPPDIGRKVQDIAFEGLGADARPRILSATSAEPPKDYAPSVPGGILNESYGLTDIPTLNKKVEEKTANVKPIVADRDDDEDDPTLKVS